MTRFKDKLQHYETELESVVRGFDDGTRRTWQDMLKHVREGADTAESRLAEIIRMQGERKLLALAAAAAAVLAFSLGYMLG